MSALDWLLRLRTIAWLLAATFLCAPIHWVDFTYRSWKDPDLINSRAQYTGFELLLDRDLPAWMLVGAVVAIAPLLALEWRTPPGKRVALVLLQLLAIPLGGAAVLGIETVVRLQLVGLLAEETLRFGATTFFTAAGAFIVLTLMSSVLAWRERQ